MKTNTAVVATLGLFLAIVALYGLFLSNPPVFDDLPFFSPGAHGMPALADYRFSPFSLRSLPYATLAWGYAAFGASVLHFRVENILLHAAVSVTLFFFLRALFVVVYGTRGDRVLSASAAAFCAALLFALHPVATYAAGYLVQRTILMAALFSLLSMLAYLHGSLSNNRFWLWASVPLYYLAVFSKEHVVMLPAVLLALTMLLHADWRYRLRQRTGVFVGLATIALWTVMISKGVLGSVYEIYAPEMLVAEGELSYPLSALTQSWLFFKYAMLWVFPNPAWMSVDMREPFAPSLLSPYLLAFAVFVAWGVGALVLLLRRGRLGLFGFALLFPWLMFMTELSTVRIQESFVLYRSYLWALGACALLPLLLDQVDRRLAQIAVVAVVLAMIPMSMDRLASFGHSLILWDDAEKLVKNKRDLPGAYRIYYNRGTELLKVDEYDAAIRDLTLSIKLNPQWPFPYNNLGAAYMKKGNWQEAVNAFSQAIEMAQRKGMGINPQPYYGRALSYSALGEMDRAKADYQLTCRIGNIGCDKI